MGTSEVSAVASGESGDGCRRRLPWSWDSWLVVVSAALSLLGAGLALANGTVLFDWLHHAVNGAFWDASSVDAATRDYQRWVFAVVGATLAGWGVMMTIVVRTAFRQREPWAWSAIVVSAAVWFVLDTCASAASAVWVNVAVNVVVAVALVPPLVATRKDFRRPSKPDRDGGGR